MSPEAHAQLDAAGREALWLVEWCRQMRWASEQNHDEASIFDAELIAHTRRLDPGIDALMPRILTRIALSADGGPEHFMRRGEPANGTA